MATFVLGDGTPMETEPGGCHEIPEVGSEWPYVLRRECERCRGAVCVHRQVA